MSCIAHSLVQSEEVIEDWELWGDPREVERRKADRRRAAQPLHVRQAQVHLPCPAPHVSSSHASTSNHDVLHPYQTACISDIAIWVIDMESTGA